MMKTYKEVQAVAKGLGIKANQKREVLETLIAVELERAATFNQSMDEAFKGLDEMATAMMNGTELTEDDIDKMFSTVEEERAYEESASEASATSVATFDRLMAEYALADEALDAEIAADDMDEIEVIVPLFEFIRADNCVVVFNQKGVQVTVGWSKKNFNCWMHKEGSKAKPMMVQSAINIFKAYINGRDGDVARIVKALTRIRRKPSIITAMETKSKSQLILTTPAKKRNAFLVIDPEWLAEYKQDENYEARFVREDYEIHLLALESRGELY